MKADIVLAGVGGQGVLSVAGILVEAARREGLAVKQAEVHGMAQRGGAVQATLRISPDPIASEMVSRGAATMILGLEPVEALRYLDYLAPDGVLLSAADPVTNVPDYPPLESVHEQIRSRGGYLIDANRIAKEAGSLRTANVVMVGAASARLTLPVPSLEAAIAAGFAAKGKKIVEINLAAFRAGRAALAALAG
ncbi:MAG: indolepyruvate oxidoreductase [Actinobacteria bacterium RBG_16_67_15]|nr:MAG: indolepyruvate oxidoreductase [Actinobacteria bacterium RBG_16_67_15]